jgi:CheY-like chemotaxis protein
MRDGGGELEIRLTDFALEHRARSEFPQLEPGRYLRLSIRDTGTGIDSATLERIFEPFFTTKESGEGTGMGLAVVHGIVTSLNGTITVESEPGKGSTFHVILPAVDTESAEAEESGEDMPRGHESVLFVDDEPGITKMAARMLTSLGYHAVVAENPNDALSLFQSSPRQFDVIITDQVMPGMTGAEMASHMLALRPELPVILCTGYSEGFTAEDAKAAGIKEFLMKPLIMRTLAESLRRVLNGAVAQPMNKND